jgi:hypothetical protein
MALALDGVIESAHMGHPDFRVNGRIFATLKADNQHGMVKLTPDEQAAFIRSHPGSFAPESGAWGRAGCTRVTLKTVDEEVLGEVMTLAWQSTVNAPPPRTKPRTSPRKGKK